MVAFGLNSSKSRPLWGEHASARSKKVYWNRSVTPELQSIVVFVCVFHDPDYWRWQIKTRGMKMSPVISAPLTIYQLNSGAERDGSAQMCMCDLLNVYISVSRADALEGSHCLQLGLRVRVERSAPAHYANQGSCFKRRVHRIFSVNRLRSEWFVHKFDSFWVGKWHIIKYYIQN